MALDCFRFLLFSSLAGGEFKGTHGFPADGLACVGSLAYVTIECGPRPS